MENKVTYNQQFFNNIEEETMEFSEVTGDYQELIDLGTTYTRSGMIIENTLDENVKFNFLQTETGTKEITISAETDYVFDNFEHNGVIQIKASSTLPTTGTIIVKSW